MKRLTPVIAFLLATLLLFCACNPGNKNSGDTTPAATTPDATTPEGTTPVNTDPVETIPDPVPLEPACEHIFTKRIVLEQVTTEADGKIANVCGTCGGWQEEILPAVKSIKILAIGNSFSDNALKYLPLLAKELGIEEIIVGKLYVGGCTIDGHWTRAQSGGNYERFDLNLGDGWVTQSTKTLLHALQLYEWDIITMQQGSPVSGVPSSLINLQNLIDYVDENKTNPNAKLYWHMTWAYSQFSTHSGFVNYDGDQMKMYNAIVDLSKNHIVPNESFAGIIPAGTTVQNYRGKDTDNDYIEGLYITTDGYHLRPISQIAVSMTWLRTLTGLSLDSITCRSHNDLSSVVRYEFEVKQLCQAAENAYLNPYEVTIP